MADSLDLKLATPRAPAGRGGSVMLWLPERVDPQVLVADLRARHVYTDARGRLLRLSPGNITNKSGISVPEKGLVAALRAG